VALGRHGGIPRRLDVANILRTTDAAAEDQPVSSGQAGTPDSLTCTDTPDGDAPLGQQDADALPPKATVREIP
jgi:hypothetical protein